MLGPAVAGLAQEPGDGRLSLRISRNNSAPDTREGANICDAVVGTQLTLRFSYAWLP